MNRMSRILIEPMECLLKLIDREEKPVLIDTRPVELFNQGHLSGAINIGEVFKYLAFSDPNGLMEMQEAFRDIFGQAGLSGAETVVVYEETMDGGFGQSCRGWLLLSALGYDHDRIHVLHGGIDAWRRLGLPLSTRLTGAEAAMFPVAMAADSVLADAGAVEAAIGAPGVVILDVRDAEEWIGASSSPYGVDYCPRKGRIPGSTWWEWRRAMKPTSLGVRFKSAAELRAEFHSVGLNPKDEIIVTCFKGARASNTAVALKEAGYMNVRVYIGSWNEWSRDLKRPIEEGEPIHLCQRQAA
jgi:thiosulfate/3-mercaptopyruvate sulfurtransferase